MPQLEALAPYEEFQTDPGLLHAIAALHGGRNHLRLGVTEPLRQFEPLTQTKFPRPERPRASEA